MIERRGLFRTSLVRLLWQSEIHMITKRKNILMCLYLKFCHYDFKRKRKRSVSVLWQKPLHQQKCQKGKVITQTTPQKSSITQRLRTDLGRSVGVTTATQLVWLTWFTAQPSHSQHQYLLYLFYKLSELNHFWLTGQTNLWRSKHASFRSIQDAATPLSVLFQQLDVIIEGVLWAIGGKWECSSCSLLAILIQ